MNQMTLIKWEADMYLTPGVKKEDYSDYILYFIENLSDELKQEIRNKLVAVCHGVDQSQSSLKIYSYKETVKEFIKRYKTDNNVSEDRKKGMIGELLVHIVLELEGRFLQPLLFLTWKNEVLKKGMMLHYLKMQLMNCGLQK